MPACQAPVLPLVRLDRAPRLLRIAGLPFSRDAHGRRREVPAAERHEALHHGQQYEPVAERAPLGLGQRRAGEDAAGVILPRNQEGAAIGETPDHVGGIAGGRNLPSRDLELGERQRIAAVRAQRAGRRVRPTPRRGTAWSSAHFQGRSR